MIRNIKRLFRIMKGRYHFFVISFICIIIVQILNFISPLLVKEVLDNCILGIEYAWVEVDSTSITNDKYIVNYDNRYFIQERHLNNETVIDDASIIIYNGSFYFSDESIINGSKKIDGNTLTVKNKIEEKTYTVTKLDNNTVYDFYTPIISTLILFIILLFLKSVLVILFSYIQRISNSRVMTYLARDGRTLAMKHIETLPIYYFESEPAGKMASRISHDVDGFIALYNLLANTLISAILSFGFAYAGMFYLDYKLALLSFIVYPLVYIWIKVFLKYLKIIAEKVNELRSLLTAKINEIINGINILQIFNFKKQTISEFNEINENFKNEQLKEVKLHITLGWNMINCIRALITTLIVVYFGIQNLTFANVTITAGLIYAYNEYLLKIIDPINIVFNQISTFEHSMVQMDRIHMIIEGESEDSEYKRIEAYKGNIKFDNVWFSYVKDEYVLKGVSFDIKEGQMVGLVGHTGSGKSTLMNLLLRFYDIKNDISGPITIDGKNILDYSKRTYRNGIGIVLQEPILFKGTIASNIKFGTDISDEEAERILLDLGGEKILKKFDDGINHVINRSGVNLSSGEKQIISLARAIAHNPSILIMDEATSHIDTETEEMIKHALNVVCQGRTVIVIAHRLSTIYNADNIIVMDHGLKVEEGTHKELVELNGYYADIYRAQLASKK